MDPQTRHELVRTILADWGRTYADEIGIKLKNSPSPLFELLYAALLMSARIPARNAVEAATALRKAQLTTPKKMVQASWQDRVDVITAHGYKRYDESAARMLGDTAQILIDRYRGDLRRLREEAERDPGHECVLLQQFKGIGKVGAEIFLREVQLVWDEVYPRADERVLRSARKLGLSRKPEKLAGLVKRRDFPRFVAGLVRIDIARAHRDVKQPAGAD